MCLTISGDRMRSINSKYSISSLQLYNIVLPNQIFFYSSHDDSFTNPNKIIWMRYFHQLNELNLTTEGQTDHPTHKIHYTDVESHDRITKHGTGVLIIESEEFQSLSTICIRTYRPRLPGTIRAIER